MCLLVNVWRFYWRLETFQRLTSIMLDILLLGATGNDLNSLIHLVLALTGVDVKVILGV